MRIEHLRHAHAVLARVAEDVGERVPYLTRRRESASVVTIREDGPDSIPDVVQRASETDHQPLHAACERVAILGLAEEMDVILLRGEVHDTKPESIRRDTQSETQRSTRGLVTQAREPVRDPQRHVQRMSRDVNGPHAVRNARPERAALAPSSLPRTASLRERALDLS